MRFDIYTFIEYLSGDGPKARWSNATKSEQLEFFLRALDFTCISVNMAISALAQPISGYVQAIFKLCSFIVIPFAFELC